MSEIRHRPQSAGGVGGDGAGCNVGTPIAHLPFVRTSKAALGSIIGALVLRATVAAGQSLPTAVAPQPPPVAPIAPEPPATAQTRWYGWPLLITDAAALSLAARLIAENSGDGKALLLSASVFLLGGPIVHAANGHATRGAYSVALRVGLSLLGWAAGLGMEGIRAALATCTITKAARLCTPRTAR